MFAACPSCGYRSARVCRSDGEYLIIDSSLPDLMDRYRKMLELSDDLVVLIDRRVGHTQVAGKERRRPAPSIR
ncbi:MAG: hypothetical protein C4534_08345 [Gaiellales bacterium]|nr:MAG: hypothetical protein C4534_08345 [Gaiellales bacterium]